VLQKQAGSGPKWERIYDDLRSAILSCELEPGSPISEVSLSTVYGCSPTPVRDAISRLRQEGFVVTDFGGRRQIVAPLTMDDVHNLAEARAVIECAVFRLLVLTRSKIDPVEIAKLQAMAKVGDLKRPADAIALNKKFHIALASLTGNKRLVASVERVLDDSERVFYVGIGTLPLAEMEAKHLELIESLKSGNLDLGISVLEEEAYGTRERVLDFIQNQRPRGSLVISLTASDGSLR